MEIIFLFVFAVFTHWHYAQSLSASISGSTFISYWKPKKFFHKKFQVPSSKRAMIDVDVSLYQDRIPETPPIMGIYTTEDNVDIRRRCIHSQYGQLGNKNLFPALTKNQSLSGPLRCERDYLSRLLTLCKGQISIQDYTSFGFPCDTMNSFPNSRRFLLPEINYYIAIHVTNETTCYKLPVGHVCQRFIQFGAFPNLRGQIYNYLQPLLAPGLPLELENEFLCYFFAHKCDPESNQIIPPCKEMCCEYISLGASRFGYYKLWKHWIHLNCSYLPSVTNEVPCFYEPITCREPPPTVKHARLLTDVRKFRGYYLPATAEYRCRVAFKIKGNKTIHCISNGHWSGPPQCLPKYLTTRHQTETKTEQRITSEGELIAVKSHQPVTNKAQTAAAEEEFIAVSPAASTNKSMIEFNTSSTGTTKLMINLLVVTLLLVLFLVTLFVLLIVRYKVKLKRAKKLGLKRREVLLDIELKERDVSLPLEGTKDPEGGSPMPRKRTFDATIFYHFDSDDYFVLNHLLPELEEERDLKLKLRIFNFLLIVGTLHQEEISKTT